jgi:hypothetical protein
VLEALAMSESGDTDNLLDVFTNVEVKESPISVLARGLGDVSVHSLLEQTMQIAGEICRKRGPSSA